ncbi:MAG: TIGR04282 family arsenosugar biosynthesis glycosyltransferase [Chloroherpetonaceae bacterium]|nr:TIGR04282 family arsenosugar biosynthesis glycosyltransferase [Chloroherpetonaceae bacterium]
MSISINSKNRAAILIFFKEPIAGKVKTRLQPQLSAEQSAELAHLFLKETLLETKNALLTLERLGITTDVLVFGDSTPNTDFHFSLLDFLYPFRTLLLQQVKGGLGERMSHAFHHAFELGYREAAIFGTDSPDLPLQTRVQSILSLRKGEAEIAIGPTEDGGYYTLAMNRFHPSLFEGITYSSHSTFEETLAKAQSLKTTLTLLPMWYDIDAFEDLLRLKINVFSANAKSENLRLIREWFLKRSDDL